MLFLKRDEEQAVEVKHLTNISVLDFHQTLQSYAFYFKTQFALKNREKISHKMH